MIGFQLTGSPPCVSVLHFTALCYLTANKSVSFFPRGMVKVFGVLHCMEVKRGLHKDDIRRLEAFEM